MARIQIPIDVITSRLNLSDRFSGIRSTSLSTRFANLKPISEFFDLKRLSKPANFGEVQSRVNYNLGYFSSNYAIVILMLIIYSLLTSLLLLFVIILVVGGMWGIGKLDGRDLDIGVFRATTSQLYTSLLVVSVPLTFIASPFKTLLWLIGFFRGGSLGGRLRSPKLGPPWGRPSGGKGSRRRREREQQQAFWEQQARVEELDSDDTDTQGVGLISGKRRFASDPLKFTGGDLATGAKNRRGYDYDTDDSSEDSEDFEGEESGTLQLAFRDKEEALVQSALARIRRAQEKGKSEVKLNQDELDALEKRRRRMRSSAIPPKPRKGSGSDRGSESERRRSDQVLVSLPLTAIEPNSKRKGKSRRSEGSEPHPPSAANPPGMLVAGPDGLTYAPVGYYPPQVAGNRSSPTRPRSATSQQLRGTPPPQFAYPTGTPRHFSDNARPTSSSSTSSRRPLPDEAEWIPANSRRSSISSRVDPFEYQVSSETPPPIPSQYMQPTSSRRYFSGPAEVSYSTVRRNPPATASSSYLNTQRSSSDPRGRRKGITKGEEVSAESSSEGDQSDELGNGVQVFVEEEPEREKPKSSVPRKPVSGGSGKRRGKRS